MTNESPTDAATHEQFVQQITLHHRRIYSYVATLLPNSADADEVMQETAIVLWRKWSEFRPDGDFVRWANGVAHRQALQFLRGKRGNQSQLSDDVLGQIAEMHESRADDEPVRRAALADCMQKLEDRDRRLLSLRYHEETAVKDIAEQLNRPAKSIYRSLERVRLRLLECIRQTIAAGGSS